MSDGEVEVLTAKHSVCESVTAACQTAICPFQEKVDD